MHTHPETFQRLDQLGGSPPAYQPTYPFPEAFVDPIHRRLAGKPVGSRVTVQTRRGLVWPGRVKGWLLHADALKLYELAYFARGDILELGCYQGLSTSILSRANIESPHRKRITTVDLAPLHTWVTRLNLWALGLHRHVQVLCCDADVALHQFLLEGRRFDLAFIDHDHRYQAVSSACQMMARLLNPGGFCLVHDFIDARNADPNRADYGVHQGATDGFASSPFEFWGAYGCSALYRHAHA